MFHDGCFCLCHRSEFVYITGYEGTSPEPAVSTEYGRGIDNGRYPTPRTVLFGLSVSF